LHDGLELETRGVPTAVICTEPFRPTAEAICQSRGVPGYRFAIVDHPIGSLDEHELRARAATAMQQAISILANP
jgi:hypothetical protein